MTREDAGRDAHAAAEQAREDHRRQRQRRSASMSGSCHAALLLRRLPKAPATRLARPERRAERDDVAAMMRSMRWRVNEPSPAVVSRVWGMCPQASSRTARAQASDATGCPSSARHDAVLHRAAQQIDLRRRRAADLDVLHAHAGDVLLGGRVRDAQPLGDDLEREPGGVQPQHLALARRQLRVGEVAVALDGARPLDVVERLAAARPCGSRRSRRRCGEDLLTTPAAPAASASRTAAGRSATLWMMTLDAVAPRGG